MTDQAQAPENTAVGIVFGCLYALFVVGYFYLVYNADRIFGRQERSIASYEFMLDPAKGAER